MALRAERVVEKGRILLRLAVVGKDYGDWWLGERQVEGKCFLEALWLTVGIGSRLWMLLLSLGGWVVVLGKGWMNEGGCWDCSDVRQMMR